MSFRKFTPLLVLVVLTLSLSGCVYLRLQKFKDQLAKFDSYFKIDQSSGLKLESLEPVLLSQDITWMELIPSQQKGIGAEQRWTYMLQKVYPTSKTEETNYDIQYDLWFKDNKLARLYFPERFLSFFPSQFVVSMFKALGKAEVNRSDRTMKSKLEDEKSASPIQTPSSQDILKNLGEPFSKEPQDKKERWLYKYKIEAAKSENTTVTLSLELNTSKDKVSTVNLKYLSAAFNLRFPEETKEPQPIAPANPAERDR